MDKVKKMTKANIIKKAMENGEIQAGITPNFDDIIYTFSIEIYKGYWDEELQIVSERELMDAFLSGYFKAIHG